MMAETAGSMAGFRLKPVPLLVTAALALAVPYFAAYLTMALNGRLHLFDPHEVLPWLYVQHGLQLAIALLAIAVLRRFVPADYGLHAPRGKTYYAEAVLWGVLFGVLMTLVDYAPELWSRGVPSLDYRLTTGNVTGWLFFEGVYVGPTEEIPFRALLVTYLAATMPGKLRIAGYEMNWAGVIVALLFALLHADNFYTRPWPLALGQQIYAFALGVLYAYWLEKSRSVMAPSIGHNVGDVVEYAILFAWIGLSGHG
jgi:membrane protease YdiL (CAAX protease family)